MKLLLGLLTLVLLLTSSVFAKDDVKKEKEFKTNEKAYEVANENAKFKRADDWSNKAEEKKYSLDKKDKRVKEKEDLYKGKKDKRVKEKEDLYKGKKDKKEKLEEELEKEKNSKSKKYKSEKSKKDKKGKNK